MGHLVRDLRSGSKVSILDFKQCGAATAAPHSNDNRGLTVFTTFAPKSRFFSACVAGAGIKPGASAPGLNTKQLSSPRMRVTDACHAMAVMNAQTSCRPLHGLLNPLIKNLGLTPQALCLRLLRRLLSVRSALCEESVSMLESLGLCRESA